MSEGRGATRVLVVDDEVTLLRALEALLRREGHDVVVLESPIAAVQRMAVQEFDVALFDIKMPELSGLELLSTVKSRRPEVEVILMTGHATVETALAAVRAGAYDYLTKPFDDVALVARVVQKAAERKSLCDRNRALERELRDRSSPENDGLVGTSGAIRDVVRLIDAVGYSAATVLVQGESGTGKELVARALHARSPRRGQPFVTVNCGALPETLLDSELFGHVKGSFTGAQRDHKGLFEAADRGTIFLDEIGDIPPATQVRLLRVLQEGEIKRVGAAEPLRVDVRVVAATHRDLAKLVKTGKFREDLFYRLNVIAIPLPPLRDRIDDVPMLAHHFLRRAGERLRKKVRTFDPDAIELLCTHRWPGNVRELENAIEHAAVLCRGETIGPADLPPAIAARMAPIVRELRPGERDTAWLATTYAAAKEQALLSFEKAYLEAIMKASGHSISAAARRAGMDRSNFKRILRKYVAPADGDSADDGDDAPEQVSG